MELTIKIRLDILRALLSEPDLFGVTDNNLNIIRFLDEMLDLKSLPSEDIRFNNAYEDALQHLINNYDWEYDYVLTNRFNIIDDFKTFVTFLNKVIHPNLRYNEDDIFRYYLLINPYLEKEKFNYVLESYTESGLPIYEVKEKDDKVNLPPTIIKNKIPFYVDNLPNGYYKYRGSHQTPTIFPCFVLVNNLDWNDFRNKSTYYLYFYQSVAECHGIGDVKIIHQDFDNTPDVLKENITVLIEKVC